MRRTSSFPWLLLSGALAGCAGADAPTGVLEGGLIPPPIAAVAYLDGLVDAGKSAVTFRFGTWDTLITGAAFWCRSPLPIPASYYIYQRFGRPTPFSVVFHLRDRDSAVVANVGVDLPPIPWDSALWVEVQPNIGNPFPEDRPGAPSISLPMQASAMRSPRDSVWARWVVRPQSPVFDGCRSR